MEDLLKQVMQEAKHESSKMFFQNLLDNLNKANTNKNKRR